MRTVPLTFGASSTTLQVVELPAVIMQSSLEAEVPPATAISLFAETR